MTRNPLKLLALLAAGLAIGLTGCANFPEQRGKPEPIWPYPDPPNSDGPYRQPPPGQIPPGQAPPTPQRPTRPGQSSDPSASRPPTRPYEPLPQSPQRPANGPRSVDEASGAAARSLVAQSRSQRGGGDLDAAAAALERAVRIEPRNGFLWLELADVRLEQGNAPEARAMAKRALSRAPSNPWLGEPAWLVVATSHRLDGNGALAAEAEAEARAQARLQRGG